VDATVIVLIVVVVLALAVGGFFLARQRRSQRLREHYGEEYERSVEQTGDRRAAEAALTEREARVRELDIRDLRPEERSRFGDEWAAIQRGFVDDPARSLHQADDLVVQIMRARGYPTEGDFDRRAEDLSVDHPDVVRHYREARAVHDARGEVDTEKQRTAVTSYRSLVEALLGERDHHHDGHRDGHRDHDHDGHRDTHHEEPAAIRQPGDRDGDHDGGRHRAEAPTREEQQR
jgi:FtsZ-interacting cell division protein ZipA